MDDGATKRSLSNTAVKTEPPGFKKLVVIVCVFVIAKEFKPVRPFLTPLLVSPSRNYTTEMISRDIYPVGTYSTCFWVILVFLITDFLRYKPVIILDAISGCLTYVFLLGESSMIQLWLSQIVYGLNCSTDVACKTYLYAKVEDRSLYQKLTGYVSSCGLFGRFICGIFAQIIFSFKLVSENGLLWISIIAMAFCTLWTFMIPNVERSIYFHPVSTQMVKNEHLPMNQKEADNVKVITVKSEKLVSIFERIWDDFKTAYCNTYVLKWCVWSSFSIGGYYIVTTNVQVLWQIIADKQGENHLLQNGAVKSISTVTSALPVFLVSRLEYPWQTNGDRILIFGTLILSVLLWFSHSCESLTLLYLAHVLYGIVYHTLLTIAHSEIAKNLRQDNYALIFGFNNFVASGISSLFTYGVIAGHLIRLTISRQFLCMALYYLVFAVLIALLAVSENVLRFMNR